ncbi:uncharacterized protein BXZ73DRAFT_108836 [Epithele typhae]|uniref:uncharacterized protein n=1 Tax=Epithele typhae TaxID=378194 RepID=UPI00200739A9|nr:uncharacterized protein BXZ73DRAFT_108836 [Epithele typhae]KAH9910520.1 hypothetical protein BXZ73DRAFT_108836 [Epithele typhae]
MSALNPPSRAGACTHWLSTTTWPQAQIFTLAGLSRALAALMATSSEFYSRWSLNNFIDTITCTGYASCGSHSHAG